MRFNEFPTTIDAYRKAGILSKKDKYSSFYTYLMQEQLKLGRRLKSGVATTQFYTQCQAEKNWMDKQRPYYNVWPGIINSLLKVKLTMPSTSITFKEDPLLIRFPEQEKVLHIRDNYWLRSCLVFSTTGRYCDPVSTNGEEYPILSGSLLHVYMDWGEYLQIEGADVPLLTYMTMEPKEGVSLEEVVLETKQFKNPDAPDSLKNSPGIEIPDSHQTDAMRLVAGTAMIDQQFDEIFEPDVLATDRDSYLKTHDEKYVERAWNRGKVGWDIGRKIYESREVSPHWRNGTELMVYWVGKGRTIQKLRPRAGTFVKKKVVTEVPTGYMSKEEEKAP